MDRIFGRYLIRITVVTSGLSGDRWSGHWEVFDPASAEEGNLIEISLSAAQASFEMAASIAHGEAVLWIEQSEGSMEIIAYTDKD